MTIGLSKLPAREFLSTLYILIAQPLGSLVGFMNRKYAATLVITTALWGTTLPVGNFITAKITGVTYTFINMLFGTILLCVFFKMWGINC
jgi:hypothetical protein